MSGARARGVREEARERMSRRAGDGYNNDLWPRPTAAAVTLPGAHNAPREEQAGRQGDLFTRATCFLRTLRACAAYESAGLCFVVVNRDAATSEGIFFASHNTQTPVVPL